MQELIKNIRMQLNLSQNDFAEMMNVSFATVNRWENGRTIPNQLAQSKLFELCKEKSVPVYQMILNKIKKQTGELKISSDRAILYHGSKSGINGKIKPISRDKCDFGKGFYMGTDPSQALTLICDYSNSKLYIVSICLSSLNSFEVPVGLDWALLVAFNRGKMNDIKDTPLYLKYKKTLSDKDLIIGNIANDRMFYVIDNFFIGNVTDEGLVNSLSALQLGKQYVAITQKACDCVKIEKEIEISHLEKLFIKMVAEKNRSIGVSLANDICKKYRRDGLYFDEILEQAKGE